jgi:hypothetical protein
VTPLRGHSRDWRTNSQRVGRLARLCAVVEALTVALVVWIGWPQDYVAALDGSTPAEQSVNDRTGAGSPVRTNLHRGNRSPRAAHRDPFLADPDPEDWIDDDDEDVEAESVAVSQDAPSCSSTTFIPQVTVSCGLPRAEPLGSRFLTLLRIRC